MRSVKLALCGFGLVGQRHVEAARHVPGVSLSCVAEPGQEPRAHAERMGLTGYDTLEALIAAEQPDGILIATPTGLHRDQALVAISAGCPALVEKPIATTTAEARDITAAAQSAGVPVLVGHHRRYNPLIQRAKELIVSGRIGDIRAAQAICWFYKPDSYFDTAPWRKQPGAGPVSVNLVHDVDLIRYLCGEVHSVSAQAAPSRRGYANEDVAAAVLTLASGAIVTISVSDSIAAPWSWEFTSGENPVYSRTTESCYLIGGSHGSLSVPDLKLWTHDHGQQDWWSPIAATAQDHEPSEPLVNQIRHFRDVILRRADPLVSAEEGMRSLQVVEAIQKSAAQGGRVLTLDDGADPVAPAMS